MTKRSAAKRLILQGFQGALDFIMHILGLIQFGPLSDCERRFMLFISRVEQNIFAAPAVFIEFWKQGIALVFCMHFGEVHHINNI